MPKSTAGNRGVTGCDEDAEDLDFGEEECVFFEIVYGTGRGGEGHECDVVSNVLGLWRLERVVGDVEGSGSGALFVEGLEAGEEGQGLAGETEDASSEEEVFAEFEGGL